MYDSVPFSRNFCNGLFPPTYRSPMSKLFRYSESLGKSNGKKWSQIWKLLLIKDVKSPRKKKVFFVGKFCPTIKIFLVSVLLSASGEGCFVSRKRDFFLSTEPTCLSRICTVLSQLHPVYILVENCLPAWKPHCFLSNNLSIYDRT